VRKRSGTSPWFSVNEGDSAAGGERSDSINDDEDNDEATRKFIEERRERFRKIFQKYHWNPSRPFLSWRREWEILETYPPDDLKEVSDVVVNESVEERISRFEKGDYSSMSRMPDEMRKEIMEEIRSSARSHLSLAQGAQPRHDIYQLALWKSERLLAP
jgi:hypothetical protein